MLKYIPLVLWGGAILLFTCVSDFTGFLLTHSFQFQWVEQPQFAQLLLLPKSIEHSYLIQKIGHYIAFFILAFVSPFQPRKTMFLGILFALLTEFLQLYFGRSGRLLDVGYDAAGLFLGVLIMMKLFQTNIKSRNIKNNLSRKEINSNNS